MIDFFKNNYFYQILKIFFYFCRSVALMHQCHEAGHGLLSVLLYFKLVTPRTEFCNLYSPGLCLFVNKCYLSKRYIFRFTNICMLNCKNETIDQSFG